jgi:hypothetical protein
MNLDGYAILVWSLASPVVELSPRFVVEPVLLSHKDIPPYHQCAISHLSCDVVAIR